MNITWMRACILVFQSVFCSLCSGDKISSNSSTCTSESVMHTEDIIYSPSSQSPHWTKCPLSHIEGATNSPPTIWSLNT